MSDTLKKNSRKPKLVPRKDTDEENVGYLQKNPRRRRRVKDIGRRTRNARLVQYYRSIKKVEDFLADDLDFRYQVTHTPAKQSNAVKVKPESVPNTRQETLTETATDDDFEALIDSQNAGSKSPPIKFAVTVAVEQYDEDSSDLMIVEQKKDCIEIISSDAEEDDPINMTTDSDTKRLECAITDKPINAPEAIIISRNIIINAANKILKETTNLADKILSIEVKNSLGQFLKNAVDPVDSKIQTALMQWFDWQRSDRFKFRSSPLFYKCYICEKSWWHLYDFREHLKTHDSFVLDLEAYTTHEPNIVAYRNFENIINIKIFYTEGDCPKCGKEFSVHRLVNRTKSNLYKCKVKNCTKSFHTCFLLRSHEESCHKASELIGIDLKKSPDRCCEVCSIELYTEDSYSKHMQLMHSVRSDVIVPIPPRQCIRCNERHFLGMYHTCKSIKFPVRCDLCFRTFSRGPMLKAHKTKGANYECKMCTDVLRKQCEEVEHLMTHTDNFVLVKCCEVCEEFTVFLDPKAGFNHVSDHLKNRNEGQNSIHLNYILVPKSCLSQRPDPEMEIKVEPTDSELAPELCIKQEITDNFETKTDDEDEMRIKEEIEIHENFDSNKFQMQYSDDTIKTEDAEMSRIFGIKVEPSNIVLKQEIQDEEESEYEDDIIRLDYNFFNTVQESIENSAQDSMECSTQESVESSVQETQEMKETEGEESTQDTDEEFEVIEDGDEMDEDFESGKKRKKRPKLYRCCRCGSYKTHKEYREHMKTDCTENLYERDVFKCSKCCTSYNAFHEFIDHFAVHNVRPSSCPECFKVLDSYRALKKHITNHIKKSFSPVETATVAKEIPIVYYQCKVCNKPVDKAVFFEHWETHLTFLEEKKVDLKNTDFIMKGTYSSEMVNDLLERLETPKKAIKGRKGCPICLRPFDRTNDFKRHLVEHLLNHAYAQHHLNDGFKCEICSKCFVKTDDFKKHMRDHGQLKEYTCHLCGKYFSDSSNYSKHKKMHNQNAYTCDICKRKFEAKQSIEKHMVIHMTQAPIICLECNISFSFESNYKKHYRNVHDRQKQPFLCNFCNLRFSRLKDKWDHLWYVHKERKHQADCPKCSRSYRKFSDLKMHMRLVHSINFKNYKLIRKQSKVVLIDTRNKNMLQKIAPKQMTVTMPQEKDVPTETLFIF